MIKHLKIKVVGRVQGIGFRFSSYEKFVELGLTGKAENNRDGSVEIEVSGEEENLKQFLRWAQQGPTGARVEKMDYEVIKPETEAEQTEQ